MSQRLLSIAQADLGDGYSDFAELADGSNSLVCSAMRRADCKEVAIKIIDCRFLFEDSMEVLRLLREIKSLEYFTKTKGGAVVEFFSSYFNATDEIMYLVTEKMDFSLDHLLDVRTLTPEEAKLVFYEVSLLTAFEHQCAWAHRDRKPDNVLFSVDGGLLPAMKNLGIIQDLEQKITNETKEEFLKKFRLTSVPCSLKDCDMGLSRYVGRGVAPASTPHGLLRQLSLQKLSAEALPPTLPRQLSSSHRVSTEVPTVLRQCTIFVNTPSYRPWEIVAKEVDHVQFANLAPLPIDMWANGVILVELLLGEHAFKLGKIGGNDSESTTELKALLQALPLSDEEKGKLSADCFQKRSSGQEYIRRASCADSLYDKLMKKGCSPESLSLVRGLLAVDPSARLTALQVLEHPWLSSVRQIDREKQFFAACSSVENTFDQDAFSKLSLASQIKQLKMAIDKVFVPPRRLPTSFFKEEAKQKGFLLAPGSAQKSAFRNFKVGQKLWAKDETSGQWARVELRERCAAGGWNVKYPSHEQLFYLPSAVLHISQPTPSSTKKAKTAEAAPPVPAIDTATESAAKPVLVAAKSAEVLSAVKPATKASEAVKSAEVLSAVKNVVVAPVIKSDAVVVANTPSKKTKRKLNLENEEDETPMEDDNKQNKKKKVVKEVRDVKTLPRFTKLWAEDDGSWVKVELRRLGKEGWDVKFPGSRSLRFLAFSDLYMSKPTKKSNKTPKPKPVPKSTTTTKGKVTTPVTKPPKQLQTKPSKVAIEQLRTLPAGTKVWVMSEGSWTQVELRELSWGGWNVKFSGYPSLYYFTFPELSVAKPTTAGKPSKRKL